MPGMIELSGDLHFFKEAEEERMEVPPVAGKPSPGPSPVRWERSVGRA